MAIAPFNVNSLIKNSAPATTLPQQTAPQTQSGNGGANIDPNKIVQSFGGINYNAAGDIVKSAPAAPANNVAQNNNAALQAALKAAAAASAAAAPGVAPTLDLNAIQAQAKSAANDAVNPLYTNYLNQYLQGEASNQAAAQKQNDLNLQQEQGALGNTLAQNTLAQNAAGKTNALTQGNINAQQQNYQLASGNAQNQKLQAIQANIGSGNLGGSGLGQQQIYNAENAKNYADAAQSGQFQYQRDTSNLSTQDTFAQLAQSSQYATTAEGQQETQTNFNLNDYLRQAAQHDQAAESYLEASRQQALTSAQQNSVAAQVQGQINDLRLNSKDLIAANQKYQPYLSTTSAPSFDIASLLNGAPNYGSNV